MDNALRNPQLHVLCCADDKHTEIGVAASTSLLIGVLVSVSEVCGQTLMPCASCVHTSTMPASSDVDLETQSD